MKNEIEKNWDEMSKAYENFTEDEDSYSYTIEWTCIKKILPNLHRKKILDLGCGTGRFDFIFSSTTFHYISDIKRLFNNIYNALDEKGTCVVSVLHPVYTAQYPVDKNGEFPSDDEWIVRYLDKSKRAYIQPWIEYNDSIKNYLSTSYNHMFGDYFNAIISAGLKIEGVEEPYPPERWKQDNYGRYNAFIETPSYMILKLYK